MSLSYDSAPTSLGGGDDISPNRLRLQQLQPIKYLDDAPQPLSACAIFQARCEARAILFTLGEIELHEAVDVLQADAIANGLIAKLGQDAVQALMAAAFREVRCHEW